MHKKTRNGFLKAACFMLAAMALSAFAVCGTLAKYTSKGTFRPPTPTESAINGSTTLPEENSYLVRSGKSGTNSITFYLAYKWEFGTTADGANDNLFRGKIFEFGALSITATQVEPNKGLAYSQPMPHAARPTSTVSEVTDE